MNNNLPRIEYGTDGLPYILTISGDQVTPDTLQGWLYEDRKPTGERIIIDDTEYFIAKCSICGRIEDSRMIKNIPFCQCGADMRKRGEQSDR